MTKRRRMKGMEATGEPISEEGEAEEEDEREVVLTGGGGAPPDIFLHALREAVAGV